MFKPEDLQPAIDTHHAARPQDRTFKIKAPTGEPLWVKKPSEPRFRWIYSLSNNLVKWINLPYFQAPPHAGGPGGLESLRIEKDMLQQLHAADIPVPEVVASTEGWIALSTTGDRNLDEVLGDLPVEQRLPLWLQATDEIAHIHQKNLYLSQAFARNIMLQDNGENHLGEKNYKIYFLDFEENPAVVMTVAQAQMRDWAFFLHSTACLVTHDMPAAQLAFLEHLRAESHQAQLTAQAMFRQLSRLRWLFKPIRNMGRDCMRLYQLGIFATGIHVQLSSPT